MRNDVLELARQIAEGDSHQSAWDTLPPAKRRPYVEEAVLALDGRKGEVVYSEVAMHMKVAGTVMYKVPVGNGMTQLYDLEGVPFSAPITDGEAGR